ncbi:MAG TPA: hypothetical protein VIL78_14625 [Hanamia sp.]
MKKIIIILLLLAFAGSSGYAMEIRMQKKETLQQKKHKPLKHPQHRKHLHFPKLPPHPKPNLHRRPPHRPPPPKIDLHIEK